MVPLRSWSTVGLAAVLTFGLTSLAAVVVGAPLAPAVAVIGWFIVVPILAFLTLQAQRSDDEREPDVDPVEMLRDRYARGELTESEFERRLDRLLETENMEMSSDGSSTARRERREPVRER